MPRVRVGAKLFKITHESSPEGIQMDITHKLLQISLFFAKDRLVAVLEKMAMTTITAVEGYGIPGQEFPHHACDRDSSRSQKKMSMVAEQSPRVARGGAPDQDLTQPIKEGIAIFIGSEDRCPVDPSDHHMVECPRGIYS
jgi:hypothetical protein